MFVIPKPCDINNVTCSCTPHTRWCGCKVLQREEALLLYIIYICELSHYLSICPAWPSSSAQLRSKWHCSTLPMYKVLQVTSFKMLWNFSTPYMSNHMNELKPQSFTSFVPETSFTYFSDVMVRLWAWESREVEAGCCACVCKWTGDSLRMCVYFTCHPSHQ